MKIIKGDYGGIVFRRARVSTRGYAKLDLSFDVSVDGYYPFHAGCTPPVTAY